MQTNKHSLSVVLPVMFGFFIMGFVDLIGTVINYVKADFQFFSGKYSGIYRDHRFWIFQSVRYFLFFSVEIFSPKNKRNIFITDRWRFGRSDCYAIGRDFRRLRNTMGDNGDNSRHLAVYDMIDQADW